MRVLFVCPFLPWPLDSGGRIRAHHLVRAAAQRVSLELWCVEEPDAPAHHAEALGQLGAEVRLFPRSPAGAVRRWTRPKIERWFHSDALLEATAQRARERDLDLVHLDELLLARTFPPGSGVPIAQHHHKIDTVLQARLVRGLAPGPRFDLCKLRGLERESTRRTRTHLTCSTGDGELLEGRYPGLRTWGIPSGFDPATFRIAGAESTPRDAKRLVFLGSMDYPPNIDGLEFFAREVWPGLRAGHPDVELDVVGRDPTPAVRALAADGIRVHGAVEDVRPWLARAAALVVPLRIGGGTRLKIVEALALGTPTVSTRIGAQGLGLVDAEHLHLADRPEELVEALGRVLADPRAAAKLGERGRAYVDERYRWDHLGAELVRAWEEIAALGPARGV